MAKLTKKQRTFIDEYLIDLNATQSAIRAGYSVSTACEQGARLLANVKVQEEIAKKMAERSRRTGINQDRVVIELARLALINASDVINTKDASIKENATEDDLACIQSIKVKTSTSKKGKITEREVRLTDKMKALELLGKHLGMWNDKVDVNVALPIIISGEDELKD